MKKVLLAGLAVGALALGAPGAYAAADSDLIFGCSFTEITDAVAAQGERTGEIDIQAIVYSEGTPADNPVSATMTCYIKVNGVPQPGASVTASGTVVIVGGGVVTYSAGITDDVQLCWNIDYTSNATPDENDCWMPDPAPFPPWHLIDSLLCPLIALLDPVDVPGVVEVDRQGNVYLAGDLFHDCRP